MEYPSNDAAESQKFLKLPNQGFLSAETEPFAAPENPQQENTHVSTESTLSSSQFQITGHTKKRKADHTELTLSSSQFPKTHTKKRKAVQEPFAAPPENPIGKMRFYTKEDEQEEKKFGVSTRLKLYDDPWKIKKTLTVSDLGHQSRLLVSKDLIQNHVLPFLGNVIERSNGLSVTVWDQDTESSYDLVLKQWQSSKGYVFIKTWHRDFVIRRSLRHGDEVGMYWDGIRQRFNFSLLQRA